GIPRDIDAATAPSAPNGTTSSTATGIDQLSYNAASTRQTAMSDNPSSAPTCPAATRSSKDNPVHSKPKPSGSAAASASIASSASPVERPGAGDPAIVSAG